MEPWQRHSRGLHRPGLCKTSLTVFHLNPRISWEWFVTFLLSIEALCRSYVRWPDFPLVLGFSSAISPK